MFDSWGSATRDLRAAFPVSSQRLRAARCHEHLETVPWKRGLEQVPNRGFIIDNQDAGNARPHEAGFRLFRSVP